MRILIDECLDQRLRLLLAGHECETAAYAGFAGLKNGALLQSAEQAGFQVLVTADQQIRHQQDLRGRRIAIVVLCAATNRLADLKPLIPELLRGLNTIQEGQVVHVRMS